MIRFLHACLAITVALTLSTRAEESHDIVVYGGTSGGING